MDFQLNKQPKGVTIIEGFPGYGLVSNIAVEFLLDHLKPELIGEFIYDELQPTVAVHKGKLVKPMSIWYVKKYNLVILQTNLDVKGLEWKVAEIILKIANQLKAKEIISLEGVPNSEVKAYSYGNKKMANCGAEPLKESIIIGVTAALLSQSKIITPLFAGAHSQLPDSGAAAKIIEVLDKYLDLEVNFQPLMKQAAEFEEKLKNFMKQTKDAQDEADRKRMSYLG